MTGGSQAEARVSDPPRFGGLGLATIQSGYGEAACADAGARVEATVTAVVATPHPTRVRNSRRSTVDIAALLPVAPSHEGKGSTRCSFVIGGREVVNEV